VRPCLRTVERPISAERMLARGWNGSGRETVPAHGLTPAYLAVGITNSAPLPMLSGQRCITLFCRV
jgi:hypothetical protein